MHFFANWERNYKCRRASELDLLNISLNSLPKSLNYLVHNVKATVQFQIHHSTKWWERPNHNTWSSKC